MLRACRQALRPAGRLAFSVIAFAPALGAGERERAQAGAPGFTDAPGRYDRLLADSGFSVLASADVSPEFAAAACRDLEAWEARSTRLVALLGGAEFDARMARKRAKLAAIREGLLRRELYLAGVSR